MANSSERRFYSNLCVLLFEYASFERTPLETEDLRMVEGVVELMGILLLTALTLLIGSCIVGSIVVALRAVGGGR